MAVRSIIFFDVKPGKEEQFAAGFTGLKEAVGFPGFLGGEFARGVRNPNIFTVVALWEDAQAYANWQARSAASDPNDNFLQFMDDCVASFEPGKPYEILHDVPAK
jgi:heme-degrading monooxygenase HmoA